MRALRFISSVPQFIVSFFRRIKLDNFLAGLIFGALISLLINVTTIQIQESVAKQRTLEALEREIVGHILDTNNVYNELAAYNKQERSDSSGYYPNSISKRFNTRVWDSAESSKYLFQLDPGVSAAVSVYYGTVEDVNNLLDKAQADFSDVYNKHCNLYTKTFLGQSLDIDKKGCNDLAEYQLEQTAETFSVSDKYARSTLKIFHPTQDRLNSFWMKKLLGNKSVEALKDYKNL